MFVTGLFVVLLCIGQIREMKAGDNEWDFLSGTRERYEQAREALEYVFKHIC